MFFFCSKLLWSEGQAQKKNKIVWMFRGPTPKNRAAYHRCPSNDATKPRKKLQNRPITYDPATGVTLLLCRSKRD
jgi:hypothetical protein